jgi:hypothetical protein
MKLRNVLVLLGILIFQACDNDPLPVAFFTASVSNDYLDRFRYDDFWVIATDDAGEVLDAQPLAAGETVGLGAPNPPTSFNLTVYHFRESSGGGPMIHGFATYSGIANGAGIIFDLPQEVSSPPVIGETTINLENCPPDTYFSVSDGFSFREGYAFESSASTTLELRQGYTEILVSSRTAIDAPAFGWIENVVSSGAYSFDMNELEPFPHTVSVSHTGLMQVVLMGHEAGRPGQGFAMSGESFDATGGAVEVVKLGYLDGFDSYSLDMAMTIDQPTFYLFTMYSNLGSDPPSAVTFPNNTLEISDPSIQSFGFTYSSPFTYRVHGWGKNAGTHVLSWDVYSGSDLTPAITELPAALVARYPYLSLDNLVHQRSQFYKYVDGYSYATFLNEVFGQQGSATHEYYLDHFQPK